MSAPEKSFNSNLLVGLVELYDNAISMQKNIAALQQSLSVMYKNINQQLSVLSGENTHLLSMLREKLSIEDSDTSDSEEDSDSDDDK